MKKFITFSLLFLIMLLSTTSSYAQKTKTDFTSVIKDSGVDTDCISISIKNVQTGKVLYKLNICTFIYLKNSILHLYIIIMNG